MIPLRTWSRLRPRPSLDRDGKWRTTAAGSYTVVVTIGDNYGASSTQSFILNVNAP